MNLSRILILISTFTLLSTQQVLAVSPSAYKLSGEGGVLGIPVTNAMITSWIISLVIILAVRLMVGKATIIPGRGQAVIENILGGVRDILAPIVGNKMIGVTFPFLIGFFFFILIHNWSGMLPGVGAFGFYDSEGTLKYWLRPANSDLNMTLALALTAAVAGWGYFVLRYAGFKMLMKDLFGNKANPADMPKIIYFGLFPIFFFVGLIEVVSIIFRPVSLSFRLFGNIFGGENLLMNMTGLFGYIIPVPVYFLELLIGLVQALVFTLLTAVYIGLICNHGDEDHDHEHAH